MPQKVMFGADPEFFAAQNTEEGLVCIPPAVFRMDWGVKTENERTRHPVFFHSSSGAYIHEDGAAFEMGVPPSNDWRDLFRNITAARQEFSEHFLVKFPDVIPDLLAIPTISWQVDRWLGRDEQFKYATEFGCDPDHDLFNTKVPCRTVDASMHPERYAGGHIHMSGLKQIESEPLNVLNMMVFTAGLAAVAFSDVPDLERKRTYLYGKPGKYRLQKYMDGTCGVEYRTPSTRWTSSMQLAERVFSSIEYGIEKLLTGRRLNTIKKEIGKQTRDAITGCDQVAAKTLLEYVMA